MIFLCDLGKQIIMDFGFHHRATGRKRRAPQQKNPRAAQKAKIPLTLAPSIGKEVPTMLQGTTLPVSFNGTVVQQVNITSEPGGSTIVTQLAIGDRVRMTNPMVEIDQRVYIQCYYVNARADISTGWIELENKQMSNIFVASFTV